jgi:hypothetical protein
MRGMCGWHVLTWHIFLYTLRRWHVFFRWRLYLYDMHTECLFAWLVP